MRGIGPQAFLGKNLSLQSTSLAPGQLVMYGYDPKFKDELPVYDKFPLLLPFSVDAKHFMGLNLHYIAPQYRIELLDKLLGFSKNEMIPDRLKMQLSWKYLQGIAKHKGISYSVKQYLHGYVKTRFVNIPTKDWVIACYLPLARFEKKSEQSVWAGMGR